MYQKENPVSYTHLDVYKRQAMFQAMRDALAEQKQKPLSIDDVTMMIAGQIGQLAPMDKETANLFQQLAKKMIENVGKKP